MTLEQRITRIERALKLDKENQTWVTARRVKQLTGWSDRMLQLRRGKDVKVKEKPGKKKSYLYLMESINEADKIKL